MHFHRSVGSLTAMWTRRGYLEGRCNTVGGLEVDLCLAMHQPGEKVLPKPELMLPEEALAGMVGVARPRLERRDEAPSDHLRGGGLVGWLGVVRQDCLGDGPRARLLRASNLHDGGARRGLPRPQQAEVAPALPARRLSQHLVLRDRSPGDSEAASAVSAAQGRRQSESNVVCARCGRDWCGCHQQARPSPSR